VRTRIKEPERWQHAAAARAGGNPAPDGAVASATIAPTDTGAVAPLDYAQPAQKLGSFRDLFGDRMWATRAIFGVLLAAVGLATFWCVVVAGQDLAREFLVNRGIARPLAAERAKIAYGFVQVMGMLACFLAFGPIAERIGRRATFIILHVGAVVVVPLTCYLPHAYWQLLLILPVFGFFTGGMHAGYAIYFPELFPDRLRATGTGICFNGGRLIAAPLLFLSGSIKSSMDLRLAITMLAGMYLLGVVVLLFMPETRGQPLPE
jgi:MFS family permease